MYGRVSTLCQDLQATFCSERLRTCYHALCTVHHASSTWEGDEFVIHCEWQRGFNQDHFESGVDSCFDRKDYQQMNY